MPEVGLLAFQIEEMICTFKYAVSGLALVLGISMWVHATYFRKEEK